MRIVVDVMGGDHGSDVVLVGAQKALADGLRIDRLVLVGDEAEIRRSMQRLRFRDERVEVVHTSEVLTMDDKPVDVLRRKRDCSMAKAVDLVKDGAGDVVISRGNTGGLMAAATVKLRPLEHVERPAIATVIPTPAGAFLLLDAGANAECKPLHLLQFAILGNVYAREILGKPRPRVGILSNGTEEGKGTDLTREAAALCRHVDLDFVGYVEGHDLFGDRVDVVVTDGFVGNIVLKTCESMGKGIKLMLETELTRSPLRKLGALLAYGGLRDLKHRLNPDNYGGAPLLGLNGTVIKAHGSARSLAIRNAIRVATESVHHQLNDRMRADIARAKERIASLEGSMQPTVVA
jgi:glycerol-3-phosphate acyltransferase PlsX